MKVLIIEDEPLAAAQLGTLITSLFPNAQIVAVCDTVEASVIWFQSNALPELVFLDIHLGDGLCFEIFKKIELKMPVIFTTAYDQYAIQAFKVNSIDYLLKPIDKEELRMAIDKYLRHQALAPVNFQTELVRALMLGIEKKEHKRRFLVKIGNHLKAINTNEVNYFYSFQKGTFVKRNDGKNYLLDQTLEQIELLIDPKHFFRINRKYIVDIDSVSEVITYSNSRLKLKVKNAEDDDFLVARERVKQFKYWFEGEKTND